MKRILTIIFVVGLTTVCFGQVLDDFSDGDFNNSPVWSGSPSQFIVNPSLQLQVSNTAAGQGYLTTGFSTNTLDNYEWQAYVNLGFAPSGSNYARVYLASDQADLSQPLNGYYLQFGEALSNDAIELFRQSGTSSISVCRGTAAAIATAFALRVKVRRDNAGTWSLWVDYAGGTNFNLDATGSDAVVNGSSFFGVQCTYTLTNANKFFFDDFSIATAPPAADTTPPVVNGVQVTSGSSLSVAFSEAVDVASSQVAANYSADNSINSPMSSTLQPDGKTVELLFTRSFSNGIQNQLTISNVQDLAHNTMATTSLPFLFFQPAVTHPKDIIITEIFPDPAPQVGLPGQEFIEIYNRSANPVDLSGWKLSDGTSTATFGGQIILPHQYWIVCAPASSNLFTGYGATIGVTNFPTLNNDGDVLTLRDPAKLTVDSVNYTLNWYQDVDKQEGGWSIEIIDINNVCGDEENWAASDDATGGTPGTQNSVFANKPDLTPPQLLSALPQSDTILTLTFNEKLEKDLSNVVFSLSPAGTVLSRQFADLTLRQITLSVTPALSFRERYSIVVTGLADCSGNGIQSNSNQVSFALCEPADSLDIVVNEILFNPRPNGVDFVEIYNQSPKYLNLKSWRLGNYQNGSINTQLITPDDLILPPAGYLAFTSDPEVLVTQYPLASLKNLFKVSLPSLPDDEGSIALVNEQTLAIDHFGYSQKMHSPFINDNEGVSLERISFSEVTNDVSNWKSASSTSGFATPGFVNSSARQAASLAANAVTLDPEIFSPSVPGRDFSKINYRFAQSGKVANIKILDQSGRLIKTLATNETLAYEGFYRWDGDRDDGSRARVGYYVVWFEVFDSGGAVDVYRRRAVIGK